METNSFLPMVMGLTWFKIHMKCVYLSTLQPLFEYQQTRVTEWEDTEKVSGLKLYRACHPVMHDL